MAMVFNGATSTDKKINSFIFLQFLDFWFYKRYVYILAHACAVRGYAQLKTKCYPCWLPMRQSQPSLPWHVIIIYFPFLSWKETSGAHNTHTRTHDSLPFAAYNKYTKCPIQLFPFNFSFVFVLCVIRNMFCRVGFRRTDTRLHHLPSSAVEN